MTTPIRITVLGSGTSVGVPMIGCYCRVCQSLDPRDRRLRPSVAVRYEGRVVVIDAGPDFRAQALEAGLERVDAILLTHAHADHILGLDDVRPFNYRQKETIPIYATGDVIEAVRRIYAYAFEEKPTQSTKPKLEMREIDREPFEVHGLQFVPVPLEHGRGRSTGYRFGSAAYLTDHNRIPEESFGLLSGLDVLFVDGLRYKPHPTHSHVSLALKNIERTGARRAYLTHVCHDLPHARTEALLPPRVRLAYDGLEIAVGPAAPAPGARPDAEFRVYWNVKDVGAEARPSAVAVGNFDGVHVGHGEVFARCVARAGEQWLKPTVLTFHPHPRKLLKPEQAPLSLEPIEARLERMREAGITQAVVAPFDAALAALSPREFVRRVLVEGLDAKVVLVGDNFRFGHRASGDVKQLQELAREFGFAVEVTEAVATRGRVVSSSAIREALSRGRVELANRWLGREFALEGQVVSGHGVGRRQTVPTLNLDVRAIEQAERVIPRAGVYVTATEDSYDGRNWQSITNIGYRPTFGGQELTIETFLLGILEGETPAKIRVSFYAWVREEKKFDSAEELKAQILRDTGRAQAYWRRRSRWTQAAEDL
ncbi:MAG: bifunctional riboflavin kinase/FAD synthetase [Acidobacteriota bacterium]